MMNAKGRAENRWENQKALALRIARITTLILPEGEGVALRFINQRTNESTSLDLAGIQQVLNAAYPNGDTNIGTTLRDRILKPLVFDPLAAGTLKRPLLVSILTDGGPAPEAAGTLANVIVECGNELARKGYPKDCASSFFLGLYRVRLLSMVVCRCQVFDRSDRIVERSRRFSRHPQGQPGHCQRNAYLCRHVHFLVEYQESAVLTIRQAGLMISSSHSVMSGSWTHG